MPGSLSWQAGKSLLTGHTHSAYLIFCLNSFSWHYSASTRPCLTLQNVAEREVPAAVLGVPAPPASPSGSPGPPRRGAALGDARQAGTRARDRPPPTFGSMMTSPGGGCAAVPAEAAGAVGRP